jgi:hypothetical protein
MNLLETMLSDQHSGQIQQLARNFWIGEEQVQAAVSQLVPALSQGMEYNISGDSARV